MTFKEASLLGISLLVLSSCASLSRTARYRDPLTAPEHVVLANSYQTQEKKELAVREYQAALQKDRHYRPALMALGNIAYHDKQYAKARTYFRRVLKKTPNDAGAVNNLAMLDLTEGRSLAESVTRIENALPTAGNYAPYLLDTLANIAVKQGRYQDAKLALTRAATAAPENDPEFQKFLRQSEERLAQASQVTSPGTQTSKEADTPTQTE